jgi:hypothetical protein
MKRELEVNSDNDAQKKRNVDNDIIHIDELQNDVSGPFGPTGPTGPPSPPSCSVSTTEEISQSLDDLSYSSEEDFDSPHDIYEISRTRKDVVRCALSLIERSSIYDWVHDYIYPWMGLRGNCVVHDDNEVLVDCTLFVQITLEEERTYCSINYNFCDDVNSETQNISLNWPTRFEDQPILRMSFSTSESCLIFFNRYKQHDFVFKVDQTSEYEWCYFPDARWKIWKTRSYI